MRCTAVLSGASVLLLVSCASLAGAPPAARPAPGQASARVDQPFVLKPGAAIEVGAGRVKVVFDRVLSDSRCPRDVQCIQAGEAVVRAFVTTPPQPRGTVELSTRGDGGSAQAGEWTLTLTALEPVPLAAKPVRASDYRATFVLSRH